MKTGVCISTVNEVETIGALVGALDAKGYHIYVVDASTDDTWRVANDAGATVNVLPAPLGIAKHLQLAWAMALRQDCDVIVQMDAGGSHDPEDAAKLVAALKRSHMVIGSRFCEGARYVGNPKRALLSRLAAKLCNLKMETTFTDWTSGYRAFTAAALRALLTRTYTAQMHAFQIEVLDWALRMHLEIAEAPITYTAGRSSFNPGVAREAVRVWGAL